MVAAKTSVTKRHRNYSLTLREEEFCRLVVVERMSYREAYRAAYRRPDMTDDSAGSLGARVMKRPHVLKHIEEIRSAGKGRDSYDMSRRRDALARMIDAGTTPEKLKDHADPQLALGAIREDAILAGERRTDGTQVNISAEISINQVLAHLRGSSGGAVNAGARPVEMAQVTDGQPELPAGGHGGAGEPPTALVAAHETPARPVPGGAPSGPLGPVRVSAGVERDRPAGANLGAPADAWESDE